MPMSEKSSGGARRGAGRPKLPPELKSKRKHYNWYVTEEERAFLMEQLAEYRKNH
jgi:hypothetical protein